MDHSFPLSKLSLKLPQRSLCSFLALFELQARFLGKLAKQVHEELNICSFECKAKIQIYVLLTSLRIINFIVSQSLQPRLTLTLIS